MINCNNNNKFNNKYSLFIITQADESHSSISGFTDTPYKSNHTHTAQRSHWQKKSAESSQYHLPTNKFEL